MAKRKSDASVAAPKKKARTEKAEKAAPKESGKVKESSKKAKGQRVVRSAVRRSMKRSLSTLTLASQSVVPSSDEEDTGNRHASTSKASAIRRDTTDEVRFSALMSMVLCTHAAGVMLIGRE